MSLAEYIASLEPAEIMISLVVSCALMSVLHHSFGASSITVVVLGSVAFYLCAEFRRRKDMVPPRKNLENIKELQKIALLGSEMRYPPTLESLSEEPKLVQSLSNIVELGKNNILSLAEAIRNAEVFCKKVHFCTKFCKENDSCEECYGEAKNISVGVLNSIHSLVYRLNNEQIGSVEDALVKVRRCIRNILKKMRMTCSLDKDLLTMPSRVESPDRYEFL